MMKIKAIIFDFDGTLADSESIHFESWKTLLLDEFGIDFGKREYFENFAGIPTPTLAGILNETYGLQTDPADLSREKESLAMKKLAHGEIAFMPFAKEVLEEVRQASIPISIVTGSRRKEIEPFLKKERVTDYFDYIITRDDVKLSKPHPEGYLKCIELMGFEPGEYLVFEDTWGGVTAAKEASLLCFGIQKEEELRSKLEAVGADYTFRNLKEAFACLLEEGWLELNG